MPKTPSILITRSVLAKSAVAGAAVAILLAVSGGLAISAQDKYSLKIPDGLALAEFRGFESWETIAVSHAEALGLIEVILGNQAMIDAYKAGSPANGKPFPDGAKMAKIHWNAKKSAEFPGSPIVPDTLHDLDFMMKDGKRFADTGGWGYAEFDYETASDSFQPKGTGANCGYACHTIAAAKDYVFTAYGKR